jgi:hypothetical protein
MSTVPNRPDAKPRQRKIFLPAGDLSVTSEEMKQMSATELYLLLVGDTFNKQ